MLGVVEPRAGEPLRARHRAAPQYAAGRRGCGDAEVVPDRLPEGPEIGDRPAPERIVAVEVQAALAAEPAGERRQVRPGHLVRAGGPQQVAVAGVGVHTGDGGTHRWPRQCRAARRAGCLCACTSHAVADLRARTGSLDGGPARDERLLRRCQPGSSIRGKLKHARLRYCHELESGFVA